MGSNKTPHNPIPDATECYPTNAKGKIARLTFQGPGCEPLQGYSLSLW